MVLVFEILSNFGQVGVFFKTALVRVSLRKVKTENPRMATFDSLKEAS